MRGEFSCPIPAFAKAMQAAFVLRSINQGVAVVSFADFAHARQSSNKFGTALAKFQKIVRSMPAQDARPLYEPRAPNAWDIKSR